MTDAKPAITTTETNARLVALAAEYDAFWPQQSDRPSTEEIRNAVAGEDRLIAQIAETPAATLTGVLLKARVCWALAVDELHNTTCWPVLRSLLEDLQRVPLEDQKMLRRIFAVLADEGVTR